MLSAPSARRLLPALLLCGAIAGAALPAGAEAHGRSPANHAPKHKIGRNTASNWSGYSIDGSNATRVTGTWTQPAARCAAGEKSWSSPWVGIDGDTSNTVEQIGTDSDCVSGAPTYYAWYEMYPKGLVQLSMAIHPGDVMTGSVTATAPASFTMTLTDKTSGATYTTTQTAKKVPARSSVEWIVEGPSNGLLSDFGTTPFSSSSATINGATGTVGSFGAAANPITMVTSTGAARATPSSVSGGSFSVTWQHA
jgi:hypothetical protein